MAFDPKRIKFWADGLDGDEHWPMEFSDADEAKFLDGRSVLEIGPGNGRQFKLAGVRAASWDFADIVQSTLDNLPDINHNKHLIESYDDDFKIRYDVVTFWYVIHHVTKEELPAFGRFVLRHLRPKGVVFFNSASPIKRSPGDGDGMSTTHHSVDAMEDAFGEVRRLNRSNGHVAYLVRT